MIEIRWHGRGGQGANVAARILSEAALELGFWTIFFPEYGPERSGAPVVAYNRIATKKIDIRCHIYTPDFVVVLDPALLEDVAVLEGLGPTSCLIANATEPSTQIAQRTGFHAWGRRRIRALRGYIAVPSPVLTLDATAIARACGCFKEDKPMPNSAVLGALLQLIGGEEMKEAGLSCLANWFKGDVLTRNREALIRGAQAMNAQLHHTKGG
jgi:pyruvate ferredoxin oxidoreductase gamma subunit